MQEAKLIFQDGREITVLVSDGDRAKIMDKPKTGYEIGRDDDHYIVYSDNTTEKLSHLNAKAYIKAGNSYSDRTIAENNARADKLMRDLRRFSAMHGGRDIKLHDYSQEKWYISKDLIVGPVIAYSESNHMDLGKVYFISQEVAGQALEAFRDEIEWYYNEYKWVL